MRCEIRSFNEGASRDYWYPGTLFKYRKIILFIVLIKMLCLSSFVRAAEPVEYVSPDEMVSIPYASVIISELIIEDTGGIGDLDVKLTIEHSYVSDIAVELIAPDATTIELFSGVGGMGDDFINTILDNEASVSLLDGAAPFTGSFKPKEDLSQLYGKDITGTWQLKVRNISYHSRGILYSWSLIITPQDNGLQSPVISGGSDGEGQMYDTIFWNDVGSTRRYDSLSSMDIQDLGVINSELNIGQMGIIEDVNVAVDISHNQASDLDVFLVPPDSMRIELFTDVGGTGDNFTDTVLDDEASVSITEGSAPFTGTYCPEGSLNELIGNNIAGIWKLEVEDDTFGNSGILNSWSIIANLADVLYYARCATDAGFNNIVANSNWIMGSQYTFEGLDPNQTYWYQVKARPLETWYQTSRDDFEQDTLTDTVITGDGDVVLSDEVDQSSSEIFVVDNPSFELETAWMAASNSPYVGVGLFPKSFAWASDGNWSLGICFVSDYLYYRGDYGSVFQIVNLTEVDTLMFDYACFGYADETRLSVEIGSTKVWSRQGEVALTQGKTHYDIEVDVSDYSGYHVLSFTVENDFDGWYDAYVFFDNIRTYGLTTSESITSGNIVSSPIIIDSIDTWDIASFETTIPAGTSLTVDVLPESGSMPIPGYANIPSGTDLNGISQRTIRLRANLSRSDSVSPILHDWSVGYTDATRESEWSNAVSSVID